MNRGSAPGAALRSSRPQHLPATRVRLDARTADLGKPLVVRIGDKQSSQALAPSLAALCRSIEALGDPQLAGSVVLDVALR